MTDLGWIDFGYAKDDPRYRFCISLWLKHPAEDPASWGQALSLAGRHIRAGEPRIRNGKHLGLAEVSHFQHSFPAPPDPLEFHEFLEGITASLARHQKFFASLRERGGSCGLDVGLYFKHYNVGLSLPASLNRDLGALHLDLDFDMYGQTDDDVSELVPEFEQQ